MTDKKITLEQLRQIQLHGDPFGVAKDPDLQLAGIDAARKAYEDKRTDINLDIWTGVIEATIIFGTKITPVSEYVWLLKRLYDARAKGPLMAVEEDRFARHLSELWGGLDERDQHAIEEVTEQFKARTRGENGKTY